MEIARLKADQTTQVAKNAHTDAAIARQKAIEFEHIELHVGMQSIHPLTSASHFYV